MYSMTSSGDGATTLHLILIACHAALNAAHLLVAAEGEAPPDPREGWWFVASLKCVGDELDADFAADAWPLLRGF